MNKPQQRRPRIGAHLPIKHGLHEALRLGAEIGCDAVQLFSRNPRGWMAKPLTKETVALFRRTLKETKIAPVLIHANYLINLSAPDEILLLKSIESFREEVERALALGVDYLVVHPGSARGCPEKDALEICALSLQLACKGLRFGKLKILLENTAGQGECIGHRFEHLRSIMKRCPKLPLGVCVDTAHSFTAGYDIREPDGLEATISIIQKTVGLKNVRAVHFNDSKAPYNSRVDRHWHIGEGHIGTDALRRFAQHPKLAHAAFILETPYDDPRADLKNLQALRTFVEADN
jgi:deoxyribonuclease-4